MVFPFLAGLIDVSTGITEGAPMPKVKTADLHLIPFQKTIVALKRVKFPVRATWAAAGMWKEVAKEISGKHCETGLYALKFPVLNDLLENQ